MLTADLAGLQARETVSSKRSRLAVLQREAEGRRRSSSFTTQGGGGGGGGSWFKGVMDSMTGGGRDGAAALISDLQAEVCGGWFPRVFRVSR